MHRAPDNPDLRLAWAFMLITTDPADAERRLRRTRQVPGRLRGLHRVNLAAALVRRGGDPRAAVALAAQARREPDLSVWLWDARRLGPADDLRLVNTTIHAWAADLAAAHG